MILMLYEKKILEVGSSILMTDASSGLVLVSADRLAVGVLALEGVDDCYDYFECGYEG